MIIRLFRSNQVLPIVVLVLISIGMWLISWGLHFKVIEPNGMPLYNLVIKMTVGLPKIFLFIVGLILFTTQAIHLNYVLNKHDVFYKSSWLPALIYVVIAGLLPPFLWFSPVLIVNSILIFALDKIFTLYKNPNAMSLAFDSAFLLSLASLFYLPAIVFVLLFAISILILRPFSWRDWVVGIIGFTLPFFFAFLYYFLNNEMLSFYNTVIVSGIKKTLDLNHLFTYQYIYSIVWILVLFVLSILRLQTNYYKNVTKSRLIQQLLLIFIVVGFVSILVSRDESLYRFSILSIPISSYVSYYFLSGKKLWIIEIMFWILIASWFYNYYVA